MSYDIHFLPRRAGLNLDALYEAWADEQETDSPGGPISEEMMRSIAQALLSADLGLEEFQKDFHEIGRMMGISPEQAAAQFGDIELNVPDDSAAVYQIGVAKSGVSITIPYWDMPPARVQAMKDALGKVFQILAGFDLAGYDPQLGKEADVQDFDKMVNTINKTREEVLSQITPRKPWWKFW